MASGIEAHRDPLPRGMKTDEVEPARFVSEPAALGLAAFGLTTMALSIVNVGIVSSKVMPLVEVLALSHGLLSPAANALCDGASNVRVQTTVG